VLFSAELYDSMIVFGELQKSSGRFDPALFPDIVRAFD
jgi:hypothetical protein